MVKEKQERSASVLPGFAGLVLLGLCVVSVLRHQDVLAGGLAVLSLGAMVIAALTPRLTGPVEMSLTGFKMELVKLTEVGRLTQYSEAVILASIEAKLRGQPGEMEVPLPSPQPRDAQNLPISSEKDVNRSRYEVNSDDLIIRPAPSSRGPGEDLGGPAMFSPPPGRTKRKDNWDHSALDRPVRQAKSALQGASLLPDQVDQLRSAVASLRSNGTFPSSVETNDTIILLLRGILAATPKESPMYPRAITELADALKFRSYFSNSAADRDKAVELVKELEEARRRRDDYGSQPGS